MVAFGRLEAVDPRDAGWQMTSFYERPATLPTHKYWVDAGILNQGDKPQCVAYAGLSIYMGSPVRHKWFDPEPWYFEAQDVDEWPGRAYDGTSVRAGAKVGVARGYFNHYAWAWTLQPSNDWVLMKGPVWYGTYWYGSMMRPDAEGIVRVNESSGIVGGHAYVKDGVNLKRGMSRFRNSWGRAWGTKGRFWLPMEEEEKLILRGGEICTPLERMV